MPNYSQQSYLLNNICTESTTTCSQDVSCCKKSSENEFHPKERVLTKDDFRCAVMSCRDYSAVMFMIECCWPKINKPHVRTFHFSLISFLENFKEKGALLAKSETNVGNLPIAANRTDKCRDHEKFLFAKRIKPPLKISFEILYSFHWFSQGFFHYTQKHAFLEDNNKKSIHVL